MRLPHIVVIATTLAGGMFAQAPVPRRAECFPLAQVRLLPGEWKTEQDAMLGYLLREDLDRLLHNFRINAGLPSTAKPLPRWEAPEDRKSTRLNSSHVEISYAVFCLKKKKKEKKRNLQRRKTIR